MDYRWYRFFGTGLFSGFALVAAAIAMDAKDKTGVWLTYSPKKDQWEMTGDLAHCYSKAQTHPKGIKRRLS
ncbi:hypothetical protein Sf11_8 [Shigella phage Sfin-1]|uniref:Uncharacterized protein n=3 Tax=Tunavirus Sfin1 TaxID=2734026 RepID=A0A5Q5APU2_9CAUD|nr:hypothetical protein HOT52_gp08 [Shigella phage Sfin-1]ATN48411.1 hypothetical protein Sf11_8 [Shigella phage Sfin-1]QEA09594.1 hypothetical protein Sfin2_25 [Shigella phage Sfin-2]QGZ15938.1 hypothetical protein Sfin6_0030 [Shigella phage Sfin-6]